MIREISGLDKFFTKNMLSSLGLTDEELKRPLVLILAEEGCSRETAEVKYGVLSGGGAAVTVTIPSLDGTGALDTGKNSLLYARETVADLCETLINISNADGVAVIAASESAAAGMVMGAIRRNIPLSFLPAFITGEFYPSRIYNTRARVAAGKATISELESLQYTIRPGRSPEMDNLNSLCIFLEGCGLSIAGSVGAITPDEQIRAARACGQAAAKHAISLSFPRMDLSRELIKCGTAAFISAGGTAAALLHILAIAAENQIELYVDDIADLKLPRLAGVSPFAQCAEDRNNAQGCNMADFTRAGGVFALFNELSGIPKLLPDVKIGCALLSEASKPTRDTGVIAKLSSPFATEGGFGILKGNLMDYGIFRREIPFKTFKGEAVVFAGEEQFKAAAATKSIKNGSSVIIKGQSAATNGMPLLDVVSAALSAGLEDTVIITDGRVLETGIFPLVSLCHGEAFAVAKTGDPVEIDFKKGKINLNVPGKELNSRIKKQKNAEDTLSGGLLRYSRLVGQPDTGCCLKKKF